MDSNGNPGAVLSAHKTPGSYFEGSRGAGEPLTGRMGAALGAHGAPEEEEEETTNSSKKLEAHAGGGRLLRRRPSKNESLHIYQHTR